MKLRAIILTAILLFTITGYSYQKVFYGIASWYGPGFHGKQTASGEFFNTYDYTCAHNTLPFGTIVKVTNLKNNLSVIVRVNDRGPHKKNRIIDLSRRAAEDLGIIKDGTAYVRVEVIRLGDGGIRAGKTENTLQSNDNAGGQTKTIEVVHYIPTNEVKVVYKTNYNIDYEIEEFIIRDTRDYEPKLSPGREVVVSKPKDIPDNTQYVYIVQVAAFFSEKKANQLAAKLIEKGFPVFSAKVVSGQRTYYKVRVGTYKTKDEAKVVREKLVSMGFYDAFVKRVKLKKIVVVEK